MIFAGAESARFRSDLRFPVPGAAAVPVCASCGRCGLFVCTWNLLDARCYSLPNGLLPARRPLSAVCCPLPARQVAADCRFAWRAALSGISGIAAPALFPAPSCCSCLFLLFLPLPVAPGPSPGGDAPKK